MVNDLDVVALPARLVLTTGVWPGRPLAMPSNTAKTKTWIRILRTSSQIYRRSVAQGLFAPLAVQQFFHKLRALEIHQLHVLLLPPVQRQADLPGTREDRFILDRRLVGDHIRTGSGVTLHDMQLVAVKIPRPVEPGLIIEALYINHQGVAFPVAHRLPHPRIDRSRSGILQIDIPRRAGIL